MKKSNFYLLAILILGIFFPIKANALESKKVQTNYQYKLVCGYYNGSDELTLGSQEKIGDFKNTNGSASNSEKACGETSQTKNYPIGDPTNDNLPKNVEMVYDSCNGSTGKQKAKVGTSCSSEGKIKTCTVKWIGYCYKDPSAKQENNKNKITKMDLEDKKIYINDTTDVINADVCDEIKIKDETIAKYNSENQEIVGLAYGSTQVICYKNDKILNKKYIKVKAHENYRYTTTKTTFYKDELQTKKVRNLSSCKKVNYLNNSINGYCNVVSNGISGYVKCSNLSLEKPTVCK